MHIVAPKSEHDLASLAALDPRLAGKAAEGADLDLPATERRGASGPRKRPSRGVGRSPTEVGAARTCAPATERRGALGPRKRPSRGVGRSPTEDDA